MTFNERVLRIVERTLFEHVTLDHTGIDTNSGYNHDGDSTISEDQIKQLIDMLLQSQDSPIKVLVGELEEKMKKCCTSLTNEVQKLTVKLRTLQSIEDRGYL